jgi:predicted MFS family arabinose efflux permease
VIRWLSAVPGRPVDVDGARCVAAGIFMGVMGGEVFIVQPGFVQGMVEYLRFSEPQAGFIASAEMTGFAVTTLLMTFLAQRIHWRRALVAFIALAVAGNLASLLPREAGLFAVTRFIAGLGCGGIVSLGFASLGLSSRPDRHFGFMIMWSGVYGAVVLFAMPTLYRVAGMDGALWFFAVFALLGLPFVPWLPGSGSQHATAGTVSVDPGWADRSLALAAMFFYFLAQGIVWAYLFRIAIDAGIPEQAAANGLTVAQLGGVLGALVPALVGARFGRAPMLFLAIACGIAPLLFFLHGGLTVVLYGVAVFIYNYGFNKTHPYLLATMATFDRTGRVVVYAVALQTLGLAVGPAIGGLLVGDGSFEGINRVGIALFAIAFATIIGPVLRQRAQVLAQRSSS